MPILNEKDAILVRDSFDLLSDEEKPLASDWMRRYEAQQNDLGEPLFPSQVQAMEQSRQALRKMFDGLDKVQAEISPWSDNPNRDRAIHANMALLSARLGKKPQEIADRYEFHLNDYAARQFGMTQGVDDLSFYAAAAKEIQREKQKEETSIEGVKAALRGDDVIPALQAWQAKNLDRMPDSTEFTRGFLQARERAGDHLEFAASLLKQIESNVGLTKGDGSQRPTPASRETAAQFEASLATLATMKPKDRKQVYAIIGAKAEAAGYDLKGFWSQMLSELGKGMARMGSTLETQAGVAADVLQNFPAMLTNTMSEEEFAATDESIARRQGIGEMYDEVAGIVAGDVDPVRPVISWLNDTVETGLIKGPGAVAPFMLASAALGPYGAGALFTADFAEQNRRDLRAQGMDNVQAMSIGAAAAPLQAAAESLSNALQLGRFPAVQRALASFTKPIGGGAGAVARYVQNSTLALATEFTEEQVQDNLIVPATQEIFGALSEDVPDVDWSMYRNRAIESTPELLSILVPMALVFGGTMTAAQANLSGALVSSQDMLEAAGYSAAQANEIRIQATEEAKISKAREFWVARAGTPQSIETAAKTVGERMRLLRNDTAAAQADLERRGILPRMLHAAEDRWKLTFNDGSTADFNSHAEADAARWQWATDQLGKVHLATRSALAQLESGAAVGREFAVEFKPDALTAEQAMSEGRVDMAQLERRVAQGEAVGETAAEPVNEADAFDAATLTDKATSDYLSSLQILGSSVNQFKDGVLRTTIRLYEGANVLTLVEEKLEGDAKQIVESRPGREWLLKSLREYERVSGDKLFRDVADDSQLQNDDLIEAWSSLGQSYLVGKSKKGAAIGKGGARRIFADVLKAGMAGAMNSETQFFNAVWRRAAKLSKLNREGKLGADLTEELERQLGIDSQTRIESEIAAEAEAIANEALNVGGASYSEENPGPNGETFSLRDGNESATSGIASDSGAAQNAEPSPGGLTEAGASPERMIELLIERVEAIRETVEDEGLELGLRGLQDRNNNPVDANIGDVLPESFEWDDGDPTDNSLGGTAVFKLGSNTEKAIRTAVAYFNGGSLKLGPSFKNGRYQDVIFAIVGGIDRGNNGMPERFASVFEDATVFDVLRFPKENPTVSSEASMSKSSFQSDNRSVTPAQDAEYLAAVEPDVSFEEGEQRAVEVFTSYGDSGADNLTASRQTSERLYALGIPGIRYLDGGSRGAGDGTRNYVIFDENLVKILEENGKPVESGETFSIAPSVLSVKPPKGVVANTTDALPSWTLPKLKGSVSKVLNSPKVRAEFYAKLDKAIEWLRADPLQITTANGWVTFMRKAGVWGDIPMPPSGLADIIANPAAYVAKLNGGYHGAASLSDTQTSAKQGMDGTVEMRKLIGEGKAPAPFVVALHNMWGILSRMLSPIDQEGMWLRLIAHRPVLDAIQASIDGKFSMTVAQWKQVVQDARASSAVESGPIGNAATSNANDFYLMLSRLNGRWNDMADVYAAPNSREMGRRFWNIGAGKLGIKNKVQRFIGLTFGTPGVIMDRWKFVEFWLPTAMEGMQANEPSSYFNYSANTPSDPVGVYGVYGGIDSENEALSLAMYEAFEVVLEESIAKSQELQNHLGEHANAGGMHWFGWNAIKNEAVGHSSLDLTKELIATFGLDIDAEKVHTTVTNGTYYTEGSPSAGNTVKFVLERGKVRVERTTLASGLQSGQTGRNAKATGRGIAKGRTGTSETIGETFSLRSVTPEQDAEYMAAVEAGDMEKAQAMVDAAAWDSGYQKLVVHQTHQTGIREFDRSRGGTGVYEWDNIGIWTTTEDTPTVYGPVKMRLFGRMENPKRYRDLDAYDEMLREYFRVAYREVLFALNSTEVESDQLVPLFRKEIARLAKEDGIEGSAQSKKYQAWLKSRFPGAEGFRQYLKTQGYDGIQIDGAFWDGEIQTVRVFLEPNQIKSADPVTRDEQGNVIPLSQRFNPADDRITFSLRRKFDFASKLAPAAEMLRNMRQSGKAFDFATAYRAASAGQSTSMLPLTALYDEAKKQAPALTEADFGKQVQALYDSGSLLLEPGERADSMRETLGRFGVRDSLGIPAMFARPMETQQETFSVRVTPAQDAEYMAAVEAGDIDKAQRMVDAAAKAAGYNVGPVWHGSPETFASFAKDKLGSLTRAASAKMAFFFGSEKRNSIHYATQWQEQNGTSLESLQALSLRQGDESILRQRAKDGVAQPEVVSAIEAVDQFRKKFPGSMAKTSDLIEYLAKIDLPYKITNGALWIYPFSTGSKAYDTVHIDGMAIIRAIFQDAALKLSQRIGEESGRRPSVRPFYLRGKTKTVSFGGSGTVGKMAKAVSAAQKEGFDLLEVTDTKDPFPTNVYAVFNPSNIKSADPVTRDADGNVIPLSQRFNPADDRITYSLRSGDFASRMAAAFSPFQRNPELRMAIAQVAKQRAQRLGAEWIEKSAVLRTVASIAKEQGIREALGYDERINSYLESLTPSARQELEFEPAALDDDPLVSAMLDYGKLMSQSTAKKAGKVEAKSGDYDGAPWLPPAWYSKGAGIMPDQMAQAMFDAGLLPDAFTGTLWAALESRIASTKKNKAAHREAVQAYNAAKRTARSEAKAEAEAWAKQTRKTAGSPKAQRDMLKAALRTLDGILSAAPPEVRARVGGYVKLAGLATDEAMLQEIERRIEKLNVELEKWLKKEGVAEIQKLLKRGRPEAEAGKRGKGKDPDMHALFAAAERAIPMTAEAVAGELARLDTLIGGDTLTPEQEALAITERGIVELVGDLKSADSGRVFSALDSLREIYAGGWLKWKLAQIEKREERAGQRADFIADTGKSGIKPERDAADKAAVTLLGKIKGGFLSLSSFQEVLSYAFGAKSDRVKALVDAEREASGQYEDVTQALADEVESLFADLAGGSVLAGERLRFDMAQRTIKTGKGELSQLEAIQALLMWRQEDGRRHMEGAMDENGKPIGPWNYDQAWIDEITAVLTPEARSVMSWLSQKYAAEHPALNALYRERYGVNMPAHDNYAPITVEPAQTKSGEVNDPVSGAAISSGSILVPGSLRARSRSAIAEPDFRDSLQTFMAHTRQLEYWKAYYDLAFEASAILGNREVLNAVKAKGGEPAATALRKWIDAIAQGGFRDASASLGMHKLLSRMTGRAASVGLLGRFSTLLVQSTQLGAASVKMPAGAYLVRLSKLLTGNLSFRDAINSPFIQRRYKSAPPIVRQALEGLGVASRPNQITRATRHLGNLLSGADAMFTAGTYAMLLDYHRGTGRALGLSGAELETHAHTEAERDTEAVAQPTRMATRSLAELTSTNPLAKVSWAYASEARQKIALMAWATMNDKAEPAQFAKLAFLVFGIGGLMTQILKNLWREAKGDDDESKWSPERLTLAALAGPLHGVPLASELMGDQGMLSGVAWAWPALKDIASGEGDMRDVDTLLSTMGLFNDTAAGIASLSHAGLDAAKVLENLASEK